MTEAVKRRYDNSRRQAQARVTRLKVVEAAKRLFIDHGYPATTIEAIAEAAEVPLPTLYRLFGSKRALLAAVLDTSFGGDDQPIAFGDRPAQRAARDETDPAKMVTAFARIARDIMDRSSAIQHVLATAAQVDTDAADLLNEIRRQRHTGQSRIAAALAATGALDPGLDKTEAADIVYAMMSPEVHRILTVERGWPADRYEHWIARSLATLLAAGQRPPASPAGSAPAAAERTERPLRISGGDAYLTAGACCRDGLPSWPERDFLPAPVVMTGVRQGWEAGSSARVRMCQATSAREMDLIVTRSLA